MEGGGNKFKLKSYILTYLYRHSKINKSLFKYYISKQYVHSCSKDVCTRYNLDDNETVTYVPSNSLVNVVDDL